MLATASVRRFGYGSMVLDGPGSVVSGPGVRTTLTFLRHSDVPSFSSVDEAYSWAQMRLKEGRHLEAISALEDIVTRSPGHDLADNSVYWIGWAHQQRGDHKLAVDVWQRLPLRFARSAKVPDALFGMAQSHEAMGEPAVAETLYEQLIAQYPKADRVKDAKKALARLRPR